MGTTYYLQCKRRPKFFQSYLKPHSWTYLKEKLVRSFISRSHGGSFMIRTAIKKPSHLLVRSINGAKTLQTKIRIHLFLTLFKVRSTTPAGANGQKIADADLEAK